MKILSRIVVAILVFGLVSLVAWSVMQSTRATYLLNDNKPRFTPIFPLNKPVTNLVVVHGIGDHCIGYADGLINNIALKITNREVATTSEAYRKIADQQADRYIAAQGPNKTVEEKQSFRVYQAFPYRDGACRTDPDSVRQLEDMGLEPDRSDDYEAITINQDLLCQSINGLEVANDYLKVTCFRLSVTLEQLLPDGSKEESEYLTGFVRKIEVMQELTGRRLILYELTWTPATRWLKESLRVVDDFNVKASKHLLNEMLKSGIVNTGIADAVAYLSDSGALVRYDLLQTFCMLMAGDRATVATDSNRFSCTPAHLQTNDAEPFQRANDTILISHSLGTRILFDSIGLLASDGAKATAGAEDIEETAAAVNFDGSRILQDMEGQFRRIGVFTSEYNNTHDYLDAFTQALSMKIPEFASSVKSAFVFTNQVPLLAANLSSPFQLQNDLGSGFARFLDLRGESGKLEIVAFHDPDDLLSYNLKCWYYRTVLERQKTTRKLIEAAVETAANEHCTEPSARDICAGGIREQLRNDVRAMNCEAPRQHTKAIINLSASIWDSEENPVKLTDAAVRLHGTRLGGLIAHPLEVHSNYFYDDDIHTWIVEGPP